VVGGKKIFIKAQTAQLIAFCSYILTAYHDIKAGRCYPDVDKGGAASNGFRKSTLSFTE